MIGNYKNEPDKYLYGILDSLEQEVYETRLYPTIEEAIFFVRDSFIHNTREDITVYIYRKEQIVPSKYSSIYDFTIIDLLKTADKELSEEKNIFITNNKMPLMFSKLSYEKKKN